MNKEKYEPYGSQFTPEYYEKSTELEKSISGANSFDELYNVLKTFIELNNENKIVSEVPSVEELQGKIQPILEKLEAMNNESTKQEWAAIDLDCFHVFTSMPVFGGIKDKVNSLLKDAVDKRKQSLVR
jgi:hypothetical protein